MGELIKINFGAQNGTEDLPIDDPYLLRVDEVIIKPMEATTSTDPLASTDIETARWFAKVCRAAYIETS